MSSHQQTAPVPAVRGGLHVVVAGFPAFGHIIPMLELAKKISKFHSVTFVVSESHLPELSKRELIKDSDNIRLHGIADGTKADYEDLAFEKGAIERVFEAVLPFFAQFLRDIPTKSESGVLAAWKPVDVVIADFFLGRELGICHERGIPFYIFNCGTASQIMFIWTLNDDVPIALDGQAEIFHTPPAPGAPVKPISADMKAAFQPMKKALHLASGIVVNSFRDAEKDVLAAVRQVPELSRLPIYCVAPLLPDESTIRSVAQLTTEKNITSWLDRQPSNSVVYVSFGSVATPAPPQIKLLGQALLALGRPFIWALRERFHSFLPEELVAKIGSQFQDTGSKFVVVNWAPQKLILRRAAVAVFLSHCGWNSTIESVSSGKPIVGWPMFADQLTNAEWAANLSAGVVIPNTGMHCPRIVPAPEIQEALLKVGGEQPGQKSTFTEAAEELEKKIAQTWTETGSSHVEFFDLIEFRQSK